MKHKRRMLPSRRRPELDREPIAALSEDALRVVGGGFAIGEPPVKQPTNPGIVAPDGEPGAA